MSGKATEGALDQPQDGAQSNSTVASQRKEGVRQLGPYRLIRQLGQGAMGTVFLAEDTMLARQVALKVLSKSKGEDHEFVARFKREATAAGKLNHVNIAGAYAVDEDQGYHYYAMEYCDGVPLSAVLKKSGCLSEDMAFDFCIQMARGLQYAHQHGIIHRDIKPENAILTNDQIVKVLDLGLSKNMASNEGFQTMSGVAMGTPHYISPEQARGAKDIDGRADIYSLGATLYHLATGATPYTGPSAAVIMTKHLSDPLPDPRDINPSVSDGMVHILMRAMAKEPEDRYRSMEEFLKDMELVLDGQEPASERVDSARSNVAARSGRRLKRERNTTGPTRAVLAGRSGARLIRTSGPQEAVRATGRQRPIEGRSGTSARSFINDRSPSSRQGSSTGNASGAQQKLLIMGAGAGVGLLVLLAIGWSLAGGDKPGQTADNKSKKTAGAEPAPSVPSQQTKATTPLNPKPSPKSSNASKSTKPLKSMEKVAPAELPAREGAYDPRAMVAKLRLSKIRAFAAKHPDDPWTCADMLKELIAGYRGTAAAKEAQALLVKLDLSGKRPVKPSAPVAALPAQNAKGAVFLSNMKPTQVKVGYGEFGRAGNLGYEGRRIVVSGVHFPNAISTHPPTRGKSRVVYALGKRFNRFQARAALNDSVLHKGQKRCATPITFVVIGDGKPLWTSKPMAFPRQPQAIDVEVTGVEQLALEVRCNGSYGCAHAVWLEPQLIPVAAKPVDDEVEKQAKTVDTAPAKSASLQDTPAVASPFAGLEKDLAKAEIAGAKALEDQRAFKLRCKDGKIVTIGKGTKNKLLEVKKGALHIEQSMGGGKMVVPLPIKSLSAQTRYELATLGLPKGPERSLRLAYAGLQMRQRDKDTISLEQIEEHLNAAAKDPALRPLIQKMRTEITESKP